MNVLGAHQHLLFQILIIFSLFHSINFAQKEDKLLELSLDELLNIPITVSSSKAMDIFNTPSSVSVIDKNMISRYNFSSVAEAINTISGLQVYRTYLKRNIPVVRGILQEHYANKVLVLINGVATWNTVTGEGIIDKINIHDVERIEVLKGPASVLYGTNAYSGAINIVLKNSGSDGLQAYSGIGTNGFFEAGGNFSFSQDDLKIFISANSSDEEGEDYTFTDEKNVTGHYKEYLKGSSFNFFSSYQDHSVLLNIFNAHESYLGVEPLYSSGIGNDEISNGFLASYSFNHKLGDDLGIKYGITYDWNQRNLSRTLDDNTRANLKGYRITNSISTNYSITDEIEIQAGFDYDIRIGTEYKNYNVQKDSLLAANDMENRKVQEYSAFAQVSYSFSSFTVLAGTRYSHNQLFGNNISSRGTLVYSLNEKNSIKVIWGQSYRAPSLFELYFRTPTNTVFGNLNLKPETSNSIELAYLTSFSNLFIQVLGYHTFYENKIFRVKRLADNPADKSTIYTNGAGFKADGLEIELKYKYPEVGDFFANYTYVKGNNGDEVNNDGHYNFKYIPQHILVSGLSKNFGDFSASALINYISKTNGPKLEIKSYVTADLHISYNHTMGACSLNHNLSAKNIFDETVMLPEFVRRNLNEIPSGYGRRIVYELQIQL